jgi:SH3 domain protein
MKRTVLLLILSAAAAGAAAQETLYITDILQLGLFEARDGSGEPIRNLVSGTELTVLERIPNFVRVRTADGDEGWVKSAFLVAEKPARTRVAEVEAERDRIAEALELAVFERDVASADAEGIVADAASALATAQSERAALTTLADENAVLTELVNRYRGALPWPWVVGALAVALAGGFLAGYWWLDASIRRRYGGFRVH